MKVMMSNLTKCATASMIIKSCYQQSINNTLSKRWDYENKTSPRNRFRVRGSAGGGDRYEANISEKRKNEEATKCKGTQTDYRESETQTLPWEAPYKLAEGANENPEILSLRDLTWGNGLPAGMHEIQIIRRMRMKKAWLKLLPPMDTPSNIKICRTIISAIEANEWACREAEMQRIMDSRMELMERLRENNARVREEIVDQRLKRFVNRLSKQRDKQIHDIRGNFSREVRKLNRKYRGSNGSSCNIRRSNIIKTFADPSSHLYAPEIRFGFTNHGRHENLDKTQLSGTYVDRDIQLDDTTKWLPTDEELCNIRLIPRPEELCSRKTKWTDEKLQKLHADLRAITLNGTRAEKLDKSSLFKRKIKLPALPVTPLKSRSARGDDHCESSSLFLQKITRGRAVQCMMYEGRNRCRELIEELRSNHSLRDSDEPDTLVKSREQKDELNQDDRLCEILDSLEGTTVSEMLDMLSKEEQRLREERKAHALVMLVERERNRREAEEAGRRQLERNRRRELDEMFRQMVKVDQDTVQAYLEDIIKEGIEWTVEKDARRYIEELADEVEESTFKFKEEFDASKDREMIVDMVQNFLIPEVDKEMMRTKIRDKQQSYLSEAHRAIYNEIINSNSVGELKETGNTSSSTNEQEFNEEVEVNSEENESADEGGKIIDNING